MIFCLIGSLTTVSYGATITLGMPNARALRLKILRMAMARRAQKAAAVAARFAEWIEETAKKVQKTGTWLSQRTRELSSRLSSCIWLRGRRERRTATNQPGGGDLEPA